MKFFNLVAVTEIHWAGWLMVAGAVAFAAGAAFWRSAYQQDWPDVLSAIHTDRRRYGWINSAMLVGTGLSLFGFWFLKNVQDIFGGSALSTIGFALIAVGGLCWMVTLVYRLFFFRRHASQMAATGTVPEEAESFNAEAGLLYRIHMVATSLGTICFGISILQRGPLERWVGWAGIAIGSVLLLGFLITRGRGPFSPPILVHLWPVIAGIALIRA